MPFLSFLLGYQIFNYFFTTTKIEVPTLIGKSINEASKTLSDLNLNLRILAEKEDQDLPAAIVIDQTPLRKKIKPNQSVYLVVSKKPAALKMPDLRNKELNEIKQEVQKLGIQIKTYSIASSTIKNLCIAQFPSPGEIIDKSAKVILYLSSGLKKPVLLPNFSGIALKEVIEFLNLQGVKYNIILYNNQLNYDPTLNYLVIDQKPLAGSILQLDENLNIQLLVN